jgi:hypothetical protein
MTVFRTSARQIADFMDRHELDRFICWNFNAISGNCPSGILEHQGICTCIKIAKAHIEWRCSIPRKIIPHYLPLYPYTITDASASPEELSVFAL